MENILGVTTSGMTSLAGLLLHIWRSSHDLSCGKPVIGLDWSRKILFLHTAHSMSSGEPNPASTFCASLASRFICFLSRDGAIDLLSGIACSLTVPLLSRTHWIFFSDTSLKSSHSFFL
jgi:hypothetical protein